MLTGIICVDDEKIVIESIKNIFSRNFTSYVVEFAQSSNEVFDILEEFAEDSISLALIISDYIMPGTKGDQLLIKINKEYPEAKKIMLTGQADLEAVENVVNKANLYRYISKPWESSDLTLTIKEALKSYQHEQEIKKHTEELENKIEERTNQLQESLNIINEHVISTTIDNNFIIKKNSKAFLDFFAYQNSIGKNLKNSIPEEEIENINNMILAAKNQEIWKGELLFKLDNNEEKWLFTTCSPLSASNLNLSEYKLIMHDITDKKRIEKMLVIDPMTKLYNRRFFYDSFPKLIKQAEQDNNPLSFILLDIDKFKQFNDLYGHQEGDEVLKKIGDFLDSKCSSPNLNAIRLGGEEFGIIASSNNYEEIFEFSTQLKEGIENLKITHESNPASKYITASFGVFFSSVRNNMDLDFYYSKADELLYLAKENGRNRIEINKD